VGLRRLAMDSNDAASSCNPALPCKQGGSKASWRRGDCIPAYTALRQALIYI